METNKQTFELAEKWWQTQGQHTAWDLLVKHGYNKKSDEAILAIYLAEHTETIEQFAERMATECFPDYLDTDNDLGEEREGRTPESEHWKAKRNNIIIGAKYAQEQADIKYNALIGFVKDRIKQLNEADAVFCFDRWDNPKANSLEKALARESSNQVTFARQVLEEVIDKNNTL